MKLIRTKVKLILVCSVLFSGCLKAKSGFNAAPCEGFPIQKSGSLVQVADIPDSERYVYTKAVFYAERDGLFKVQFDETVTDKANLKNVCYTPPSDAEMVFESHIPAVVAFEAGEMNYYQLRKYDLSITKTQVELVSVGTTLADMLESQGVDAQLVDAMKIGQEKLGIKGIISVLQEQGMEVEVYKVDENTLQIFHQTTLEGVTHTILVALKKS